MTSSALSELLASELRRLVPQMPGVDLVAVRLSQTAEAAGYRLAKEDAEATPEEHACEWCAINLCHQRCPANAAMLLLDPPCPHCGGGPEDYTMHVEGCPTFGTCASTRPATPRPWHPEPDTWTLEWAEEHFRTVHGGLGEEASSQRAVIHG